jgi:competence protein ComEA
MRVILGFFLFLMVSCTPVTSIDSNKTVEIEVSVLMLDQSIQAFTLPKGSILKDLLELIDCSDCDLARFNPQQVLYPYDQIVLYPKGQSCVSINASSLEELDQLSGIGPAIAQRIIDYRLEFGLFQRIEDLMNVKGIKEKLFEKVKDFICLCAKPSIYFPS